MRSGDAACLRELVEDWSIRKGLGLWRSFELLRRQRGLMRGVGLGLLLRALSCLWWRQDFILICFEYISCFLLLLHLLLFLWHIFAYVLAEKSALRSLSLIC